MDIAKLSIIAWSFKVCEQIAQTIFQMASEQNIKLCQFTTQYGSQTKQRLKLFQNHNSSFTHHLIGWLISDGKLWTINHQYYTPAIFLQKLFISIVIL